MSQYDDDAGRLSDICDGCGEMFADCDCEPPECVECGRLLPGDTQSWRCDECRWVDRAGDLADADIGGEG